MYQKTFRHLYNIVTECVFKGIFKKYARAFKLVHCRRDWPLRHQVLHCGRQGDHIWKKFDNVGIWWQECNINFGDGFATWLVLFTTLGQNRERLNIKVILQSVLFSLFCHQKPYARNALKNLKWHYKLSSHWSGARSFRLVLIIESNFQLVFKKYIPCIYLACTSLLLISADCV